MPIRSEPLSNELVRLAAADFERDTYRGALGAHVVEHRREEFVPVVLGDSRRVNYIPCLSGLRDLEGHVGAESVAMHSEDARVLDAATVCGMEDYVDAGTVPQQPEIIPPEEARRHFGST